LTPSFLPGQFKTEQIVFTGKMDFFFGSYGPFKETCRLDFSAYRKKGTYFIRTADAELTGVYHQ
jgi:hypothetical protein